MNKYQEALNKIKTEFWEWYGWDHCEEETNTLQELVDKETPKKVVEKEIMCWLNDKPHYYAKCPNCNSAVKNNGIIYCSQCGQKLDWSDE